MISELTDHLHEALLTRGYSPEGRLESSESFGSWYQDYVRGDRRVRLIWDGRDQWFVLQGGQRWHDLAVKRPVELVMAGIEDFLAHAD